MIKNLLGSICLFGILLSITSCSKSSSTNNPNPNPSPTPTYYHIINWSDSNLTIKIYANATDYLNSTNPVYSKVVPQGVNDSTTVLTVGNTYYMDYYSADYNYSNWDYNLYSGSQGVSSVTFVPSTALGSTGHLIDNTTIGGMRALFINNTQSQTVWKVISSYTKAGSTWQNTWSTLTANQKLLAITFKKNFKAEYTDSAGTHEYNYSGNDNGTGFSAEIDINDSTALGSLANGVNYAFIPSPPPYARSFDTLSFFYRNDNTVYIMLKQ